MSSNTVGVLLILFFTTLAIVAGVVFSSAAVWCACVLGMAFVALSLFCMVGGSYD